MGLRFIEQPRQLDTRVVFLLLRDCKFPGVLGREVFFDLSRDRLAGQRALKLWLLEEISGTQAELRLPASGSRVSVSPATLEELRGRIADWPGVAIGVDSETAVAFAREHEADFERVFLD